jgi:hypothetical protein
MYKQFASMSRIRYSSALYTRQRNRHFVRCRVEDLVAECILNWADILDVHVHWELLEAASCSQEEVKGRISHSHLDRKSSSFVMARRIGLSLDILAEQQFSA